MRTIGQLKVEQFLQQQVAQFTLPLTQQQPLAYCFSTEDVTLSVSYDVQKKLLAQLYPLIVTYTFPVTSSETTEASYKFHKKAWFTKKQQRLLPQLAFFDPHVVDIASLTYTQCNQQATLRFSVIPGSYHILIFPPMHQGIAFTKQEIAYFLSIYETLSKKGVHAIC
ncbi:hypothetical protein [Caryophanon tenue]|uniref:Uncharacterized protein n=1 Tax=Caryophanon tenue TaxID=33978 RepID=A0A1C0YC53_9BACL|nr:hypothetical protein [Caryophanon tenue]OCS84713.1 hypothetical protein A6M13_03815 [Caryophanon tenue]